MNSRGSQGATIATGLKGEPALVVAFRGMCAHNTRKLIQASLVRVSCDSKGFASATRRSCTESAKWNDLSERLNGFV